jgi:hypothetical protein
MNTQEKDYRPPILDAAQDRFSDRTPDKPALQMRFIKHGCTFTAEPLTPLSWIGFALEQCALWHFGRGNFRLGIMRDSVGPCFRFTVFAPVTAKVGPMIWSGGTCLAPSATMANSLNALSIPFGVRKTTPSFP